jgi:hypothetical protein
MVSEGRLNLKIPVKAIDSQRRKRLNEKRIVISCSQSVKIELMKGLKGPGTTGGPLILMRENINKGGMFFQSINSR